MEDLYPICRSITGDGVRKSLALISREAPLTVFEVPSGTPVFDWVVPREWNVREAWVEDPSGRRIVDLADHTLHLVSYSVPVDQTLSLAELRPHLHSLPDQPQVIPYRTSYYREDWGFCATHEVVETLADGAYKVRIDSSLTDGSLTYGECLIPGESDDEFLVYTHVCHPSLCNDNLSGMALAATLASSLRASRPQLTFRFVFAPGTIGSITWLARNEARVGHVRHGIVLGLLGDRGPLTYKRSRRGNAEIDQIAMHALSAVSDVSRYIDYSPYGYDERQFCSPGFDLPVGRLTRTPNGEYPEYHSSADNFSLLDEHSLAESLRACATIMDIADRNETYLNLNPKCEPMLGRRGLYRSTGGTKPGVFEHAMLWVLNQSDGSNSLLDIAERSRLPFQAIADAADALLKGKLLQVAAIDRNSKAHAL